MNTTIDFAQKREIRSFMDFVFPPDIISSSQKVFWKLSGKGDGLVAMFNPEKKLWQLNAIKFHKSSYKKRNGFQTIIRGMSVPNRDFYSLNEMNNYLSEWFARIYK